MCRVPSTHPNSLAVRRSCVAVATDVTGTISDLSPGLSAIAVPSQGDCTESGVEPAQNLRGR